MKTRALALLVVGLLCAGLVHAEKADRDKPINIEADKMTLDDGRKESVFEGNVVLTQGTMQMKGDRVIVRQDGEGFQYGTAYGKPASFRQKRDGVDEYIDGFAERLEFDGRRDLLQMFNSSRLVKGTDEVRGDYISYNAKTELFQVIGGGKPAATPANPDGRVKAVILPKPRTPKDGAPPATGSTLKPTPELGSERR
jgi:lipopolysaccharide export system protein LptA